MTDRDPITLPKLSEAVARAQWETARAEQETARAEQETARAEQEAFARQEATARAERAEALLAQFIKQSKTNGATSA